MTEPQKVSFEQGLERLEAIAEKLGEAELSVEETIALLREGKGLEQALRAYLEKAEKDLEQIEKGKGLTAFVIEDPADGAA
ncbi:MAG: exodeoxyribonuclease VII small subunit [Gaiellales bacterium]